MPKKTKKPAPVLRDQTVSQALATILGHNLDYLAEWEEAARTPEDIEGVHQMRVTLRRMRSVFSVFRTAIPKAVTGTWSEEMRWLANQLGLARDLDVFIHEGLCGISGKLPLPGEARMMELAQRYRGEAYDAVRAMLDGERYVVFKEDFRMWLDAEGWRDAPLKDKQRKRLDKNVVPFARKLLDRQERRVLEAGSHVDRYAADQMHRLRIECKKLRYASEFFAPIFAGMDEFIEHMKGVQDLLGVMHDVAVMSGLLDRLLENEEDHDTLRYAGGLVGWRTRQYYEIIDSFEARWEECTEAKHPWWRKSAVQ